MKYCAFCGKELAENEKCTCAASLENENKAKAKKRSLVMLAGAAVLVVVAAVALFAIIGAATKADPFDYITVSYAGYNTCGYVEVDFDRDALLSEFIGEEPTEAEEMDEYLEWYNEYERYYDAIDYTYPEDENLSNGDTFTITVTVSDFAKSKIKSGSKEFTVSGLKFLETVDIFADIEVVYEGVAGDATASINRLSDEFYIQDCTFSFSENYDLSPGDKITVTITSLDQLTEYYEVVPKEQSKEFIVGDLPEYVTSVDQLPKDKIDEIAKLFLEKKKENTVENWIFSYNEPELYGTYLMVAKDSEELFVDQNHLEIIVCRECFQEGEFDEIQYFPLIFKNILVNPDGTLDIEFEEGSSATSYTDIEGYLDDFKDDYTVTEVK